ncbi:MAG: IS21-like element helper ATPase IstB [Cyanobacteria bacterium REEB65]|nr:IS21-like element helper ATPase IstB [Cyanobacteria bacterium REEB65]
MLNHPTIEKLQALRLFGMAKAFQEQLESAISEELGFDDRLGLLVDRELTLRDDKRLQTLLRNARLRQSACLEDVEAKATRGIDRTTLHQFADPNWIRHARHVFITGPTGVGKTYLACAIGQQACRMGYSAYYARSPRLFQELALGRGDGRYGKILASLAKKDVLILDDWGIVPLTDEQRRDLFEIAEDRHDRRSLVIASQVPPEEWHQSIGDPTLADAILDRIVHQAYKVKLTGASRRKTEARLPQTERSE